MGANELIRGDQVLIKKLQIGGSLTADEIHALLSAIKPRGQVPRHSDIVAEGSTPECCILIMSGFACRYKLLPDGDRQIHAFKIPGDVPDLYTFILGFTDHAIGALTSCDVAAISHHDLEQITRMFPKLPGLCGGSP